MKKLILVFFALCSSLAFGQGAAVNFSPVLSSIGPIPFVGIHICTTPTVVTSGVCSTPVTVYQNITLTTPYSSAIQTDGLGNFPVMYFTPAANYCYSLSGFPAATNTCYPFSVPLAGVFYPNSIVANGVIYATIQAAITGVCTATPAGGTIFIGSGTYAQGAIAFTGLCAGLNIVGNATNTADNIACATTITSTLASAELFLITQDHVSIRDMCIKNIGTGGASAIHLNGARWGHFERLYFSGPWGAASTPTIWLTPNIGVTSTIFNQFTNVHTTGTFANGIGCLLDSGASVNQVINANVFTNTSCTGGTGASGIGLKFAGGANIVNENVFIGGQYSTTLGTGIVVNASSTRDTVMIVPTIEGSATGITIAAGNLGFKIDEGEVNANTGTNITNNTAVTDRAHITGNIGSNTQIYGLDQAGNLRVNSLAFGGAAFLGANGWYFATGAQICASGTCTLEFDNTGTQFLKPGVYPEQAAPAGSAGNCWVWNDNGAGHRLKANCNNAGATTFAFASDNLSFFSSTTSAQLRGILSDPTGTGSAVFGTSPAIGGAALTTPTIGGGSTLNLYKTATDTPGAITVNAQTCTDRSVAIAGSGTGAVILPTANYAIEANLSLSPGQTVAGTAHYRICNGTAGNITLNAASTFNLAVIQ